MPSPPVTQEDLAKIRRDILGEVAPAWVVSEVQRLKGFRRQLEQDDAFGNIMGSTQWVGGASIVDGTVQGKKLAAEVVISSLFTTGEPPADRWELDPTGMRVYGTVEGVPNTPVITIETSGDFTFGVAPEAITFDAATGTLSAPTIVTSSLSISQVTSGVIGGTYDTAPTFPRVRLTPTGLKAQDGFGNETVNISGTDGSVSIVGTFLAGSALTGDRIQMRDTGIELWRSGVRQFYLARGSSNAIQMLLMGPSANQYIGMQPDTGFWIGASTYASAPFKVSPVGVATMVGATFQSAAGLPRVEFNSSGITGYSAGGAVTVSISGASNTITGGLIRTASSGSRVEMDTTGLYGYSGATPVFKIGVDGTGYLGGSSGLTWNGASYSVNGASLVNNSVAGTKIPAQAIGTAHITDAAITDAKIGSVSAGKITTGELQSVLITIGAGGAITDADGSTWNQSGLTLKSTGSVYDAVTFNHDSTVRGYISGIAGTIQGVRMASANGLGYIAVGSTFAVQTYTNGSTSGSVITSGAGIELAGELKLSSISWGGVTPAAWPTGGSPTSVIMSVDAGASLLAINAGYVVANIAGVNRKLLYVA
jgi:hypothetical protein